MPPDSHNADTRRERNRTLTLAMLAVGITSLTAVLAAWHVTNSFDAVFITACCGVVATFVATPHAVARWLNADTGVLLGIRDRYR